MGELIEDANIGRCWGCDWIMQEWHEGWETRNSDPYDDGPACEQELMRISERDTHQGYRCINEEELIDKRMEQLRNPSPETPVTTVCWNCDWVLEQARPDSWVRSTARTYKTQGTCEQALWQLHKRNPDINYRCIP